MSTKIYKRKDSITKEELLNMFEFHDIPSFGSTMSWKKFIDYTESGCILDYDGSGCLVIGDKMADNTCTCIDEELIYIEDHCYITFNLLYKLFGDELKVQWFNK